MAKRKIIGYQITNTQDEIPEGDIEEPTYID